MRYAAIRHISDDLFSEQFCGNRTSIAATLVEHIAPEGLAPPGAEQAHNPSVAASVIQNHGHGVGDQNVGKLCAEIVVVQ